MKKQERPTGHNAHPIEMCSVCMEWFANKPHRHKWEIDVADCPRCGLGRYFTCECGGMRLEDKEGNPKRVFN